MASILSRTQYVNDPAIIWTDATLLIVVNLQQMSVMFESNLDNIHSKI